MVDFSTLDDSEANGGLNLKFTPNNTEEKIIEGLNIKFIDPEADTIPERDLTPGRNINPDRKKSIYIDNKSWYSIYIW
jgi:hypothetical protein